MTLQQVQSEATSYLKKLSSVEALEPWLIYEIKNHFKSYLEAIVLVHVNGSLMSGQLSTITGYQFDAERMDVITDFFLRDILLDKKKKRKGCEILSGRQLSRRRKIESATILDFVNYDI